MNIDANSTSAPPAPASRAGAGSTRGRAAGDVAADGAGTASFMSMLDALTGPAEEAGMAKVDGPTPSGEGHVAGDDDAGSLAVAGGPDGTTVPPANPALAAAEPARTSALAASASGAGAMPDRDASVEDGRATASLAEPQEQQALRAAMDAAANAGARRVGAAAADASTLARHQATEAAMSARELASGVDAASSAKDAVEAFAWRPPVAPLAGAGATSVVSMFEAGLAGLRAGPGGRLLERSAARVNTPPDAANGGFVPWADAGPGIGASQAASPVYAPTAATPVPTTALAQKLHFWVAGGVQSAELQLDAFGGGSVEVHIAVKGDEAYVEFRSDQPQARKLLLDAMPQLEDLLAGEGLMLSGGFVGGSAQYQTEGGSARRDRFAGARPAQDRIVEAPVAAAATLVRPAVGSAVDLFV